VTRMLTRDLFARATVLVHAVMGWLRSARKTSNAVLQSATTLTIVYSAQFVWLSDIGILTVLPFAFMTQHVKTST